MIYFLFVIPMFISQIVFAGQCEGQLKSILSDAKTQVKNSLVPNSPCYNAAMIGRKNGPPGCFPGKDLSTLLSILNPVLAEAKGACDSICYQEKKRTSCYELTSQSRLKEIGILGAYEIIKYPLVIDTERSPQ